MLAQSPPQGTDALALLEEVEGDWAARCQALADGWNGLAIPADGSGGGALPQRPQCIPLAGVLPACPSVPLGAVGLAMGTTGKTLRAEESDTDVPLASEQWERGTGTRVQGQADVARRWLTDARTACRAAWRDL